MTTPVSGSMGLQQILDLRQSILDKNQSLQSFRAKGPVSTAALHTKMVVLPLL